MERTTEIERKFEGPDGAHWSFAPVAAVGPERILTLRATYWDTPHLALVRSGCSLRHREGGTDAGWHLKIPRSDGVGREEIRVPLSADLPDTLREIATELVGPLPLVPVAEVDTERRECDLLIGGTRAAVFVADRVRTRTAVHEDAWNEFEIELAPGVDPETLDVLSAALLTGEVRAAGHSSKVARALGLPRPVQPDPTPSSPARTVLGAYVERQVGMLQAMQPGLRTDAPDAVHKSRVATRRLRSLLRTYAGFFDAGSVTALRSELRWWGEMLGSPRDAEVLREEFGDLFAELGDAVALDVRRRIQQDLGRAHAEAHADLLAALDTDRARALRAGLVQLVRDPLPGSANGAPADTTLPAALAVEEERLESLWRRAERKPDRLARWHEVRKAAKATRYGAEVLAQVGSDSQMAKAAAYEEITEALGTLQDTAVAGEAIDRWESAWGPDPAWGLLRDIQADRAEAALALGRLALAGALASGPSDAAPGSVH